jgi:hypothetical protein
LSAESFEVAAPVKQEVAQTKPYAPSDVVAIATQLGACLAVQRTYGKQGGDIESMTRVFVSDLKAHPSDKVVKALEDWRLKSPDFPTPADIINLLNPQPIWSAALFNEISERRKKGDILSLREEEYLKGYKKQAMKGL